MHTNTSMAGYSADVVGHIQATSTPGNRTIEADMRTPNHIGPLASQQYFTTKRKTASKEYSRLMAHQNQLEWMMPAVPILRARVAVCVPMSHI